MKKKLIIVAAALMLASSSGLLIASNALKEIAVNKNINVEVYKTASYISPVYDNTTASLEVTVVKVKDGKRNIVWQHSYKATELKNFPQSDKPFTEKIAVTNINDRKDKLEVYYKVTYNSEGSILNYWNSTTIGKGQQTGKLHIEI